MKGLLLKDAYLTLKYCKMYMVITVLFTAVYIASKDSLFFLIYPGVTASIIPVTLYAYDERERWCGYCQTLPVSKKQYVYAKYLLGCLYTLLATLFTAAVYAVRELVGGTFALGNLFTLTVGILFIGLVPGALLMPFVFRFGAEKGRIAYFFVVAFLFSILGTTISTYSVGGMLLFSGRGMFILPGLLVGSAALYVLSALLSGALYRKREI